MIRLALLLILIGPTVLAQEMPPGPPVHMAADDQRVSRPMPPPLWKEMNGGYHRRLTQDKVWLPYLITEDRGKGIFYLQKFSAGQWTVLESGTDLAALKAEGIRLAGAP